MKWRRKDRSRGGDDGAVDPPATDAPGIPPYDVILAETIARHFVGGVVQGRVARLGSLGISIECAVPDVRQWGDQNVAVLNFWLTGRPPFDRPVFASISGYQAAPEAAIVEGGCAWACTVAPLLRVALAGDAAGDGVEVFESRIGDRRFSVAITALDRATTTDDVAAETIPDVRRQLGGNPWLAPIVLGSNTLPILAKSPTFLGVFVGQTQVETTTEVKVNGGDWWPSNACFPTTPGPASSPITLMRELAILTPLDPPGPLTRDNLESTLHGLGMGASDPWRASGWPGWQTHGGQLGRPITEGDLARLAEQVGRLPADYKRFLLSVGGSGSGPGYGLVAPVAGERGILLANAGCGVSWVLRLDGTHHGEVWVDAAGSDQRFERVAASFDDWYLDWLDAAVRATGPWVQWDPSCCATPKVISQFLDAAERDAGGPVTDLGGRAKWSSAELHGCNLMVSEGTGPVGRTCRRGRLHVPVESVCDRA